VLFGVDGVESVELTEHAGVFLRRLVFWPRLRCGEVLADVVALTPQSQKELAVRVGGAGRG
jgi:hypothetical protein